jgi:septum site-determining protein MinD
MAECIVVTSGKGGVGKTTTTANLGMALALNGSKVAVVDADIGLRNLDVILGLENRIVYDLVHVIEGECRLKQALIRDKRVENLFLLPAAQTRDKNAVTPAQMRELVNQIKAEGYDYVIVDCPAGIEQGFKNAVAGADKAIIVTTPEVSAIRDADRIIGMVEAAELPEPQLIINRYRPRMVASGDMMNKEDILEILSIPLLGIVPDHEEIIISANRGASAAA